MASIARVFQICIPHTHRDYFDYYAETLEPVVGARVWVPFRKQTRLGVVVGVIQKEVPHAAVKSISAVIDTQALLSEDLLALCRWVSDYYQSPLSEVIPLVLPKTYRQGLDCQRPVCEYFTLNMTSEEAHELISTRALKQHALIDFFSQKSQALSKNMLLEAGFSSPQWRALLEKNVLATHFEIEKPPGSVVTQEPLPLNDEQANAVETMSTQLASYQCFLLQGVTGSGKTEVYLQVIANVLSAGKQVLVLVPEIGLTPQLLSRFRSRFSEPMSVIHSGLNDTERQRAWQWAYDGEVRLVIGTRAAIFTPMPALGLIVVDEEHDASLKQIDGVRYSARDTALMRAHARHIPIILGSATPSLESLHNCALKKYTLLRLNQKAMNDSPLHYQLLDLRNQTLQHGLAPATLQVIREHLEQGNQVLVFINRRGFSPVLLCHQCGWMADCARCDAHLTVHRRLGRLVCHHCGFTEAIHTQCKACHARELLPVGAGTQRVHEYLSEQFPDVSLLRVDRDEVRKKQALDHCLTQISERKVQLIVGTQMLAKGHHFPRLTLVVVLDTDNGFFNQDFRALERLGQLLTQVAGRAGRAEHPGHVLIQTHVPQHPALNVLVQQGYDAFAQSLLSMRQDAQLPPYHFLVVIRAQHKHLPKVLDFLTAMKAQCHSKDVGVLGPAPAPLARKSGQHRMQLLLKSASRKKLSMALKHLRHWLADTKMDAGMRWSVDVDPMDLS